MKPEPKIVDGVPMCVKTCPAVCRATSERVYCAIDHRNRAMPSICQPAVRNLVAQVAEVKRMCQSHNNPGSNPSTHKLAGDVLWILEGGE